VFASPRRTCDRRARAQYLRTGVSRAVCSHAAALGPTGSEVADTVAVTSAARGVRVGSAHPKATNRRHKWAARGRADAPVFFRAVVRATIEGAEGAENQPGNQLAAIVFAGLAGHHLDVISPALGAMLEQANHDEWVAERADDVSGEIMKPYGDAFLSALVDAGNTFGSTSGTTVAAFLAGGPQGEELRWRLALAAVQPEALGARTARGSPRFVVFQYCISLGIVTFRRSSAVKVVPAGGSTFLVGLPYTLLTLAAGWWGLPWGPIYTLGALAHNLGGGTDVTDAVSRLGGLSQFESAGLAAVESRCGRCGKRLSPAWRGKCEHCQASYTDYPPVAVGS